MASRFPPRSALRFDSEGAAPAAPPPTEARAAVGASDAWSMLGEAEPAKPRTFECDACGKVVDGEPAGRGLFVWTRGEETRYEEPPLCARCANAIGLAALAQWELEEDGE